MTTKDFHDLADAGKAITLIRNAKAIIGQPVSAAAAEKILSDFKAVIHKDAVKSQLDKIRQQIQNRKK
jgi:hypothetical protein